MDLALIVVDQETVSDAILRDTLGVLLKYQDDLDKIDERGGPTAVAEEPVVGPSHKAAAPPPVTEARGAATRVSS